MDESPAKPPIAETEAPLLDLDTLIQRPSVSIDGARYEILSPNEISVIESHRFGVWGRRLDALASSVDPADETVLAELTDHIARTIGVGIPPEVFATLSGSHKLAIVDVFTGLLLRTKLDVAGAIARAAGLGTASIGASSSPGSSGSTADRRPGGWLKRLWPW